MEKTWAVMLLFVTLAAAQYGGPVNPPVTFLPVVGSVLPGEQSYYRILPASPQFSFPTVPQIEDLAAVCNLSPAAGSSVSGQIQLFQSSINKHDPVHITGTVHGLTPPGQHGFHLHKDGNIGDNCKAAGPHFNPYNQTHGGPDDAVRHAGDFGNIDADSYGNANINKVDNHITLYPGEVTYAIGRAIVVHAGTDDLGKGGNEESLKTGNAGGRLACCIVEAIK
ncbi:superoxide dismutase [Cu-Zn]-like [Periplaneta americana]|uniref:superoxide dismutase [Cu-Zn]-like n=1 Tax=Periplaneta americana TaxID=6978 RepID=UPI0037E89578